VSDRLTTLVMIRVRTGAHTLRSQVRIGSKSDCLLGQLKRILDISDSDAGVKEENLEGSVGGEGECGDEVEVLLVREIRSLDILSVKKTAKQSAREMPGVAVMVMKIYDVVVC